MVIEVSIQNSQVTVIVAPEEEIENIYSLRNRVKDIVYQITDIFTVACGYAYSIEITSVVGPDGGKATFGVGVPVLTEMTEGMDDVFRRFFATYQSTESRYLRHALADFRQAISHPRDTGFYCYRAIESLKYHISGFKNVPESMTGWQVFRETVGATKDEIMHLKKEFADERRHGGTISITDRERAWALATTWRILNSYVQWYNNEFAIEVPDEQLQ